MDVFMDALINILAILGIIIATFFIVFFLGDLLLSVIDPKKEVVKDRTVKGTTLTYEEIEIREKRLREERIKFEEEMKQVEVVQKQVEIAPKAVEYVPLSVVEETKVDYWKAAEEEKQLNNKEVKEKSAEEELREQRLKAIEERRLALMKELEEDEEDEEEAEEEESTVDFDDLDFGAEEVEEIEEVEEKVAPVVIVNNGESDRLREELESLRREINAERARNEMLSRQAQQARAEADDARTRPANVVEKVVEVFKGPMLSREEYEVMLVTYNNRLELIKRQLKKIDKEYLPLARVWRTFARDESKLNRKEALVAKQKTVLYGVNNYADIDEEKAKKLAEDLDLLDGLKLSVAHCKEVMDKNKDKFPVLENTHNVLKQTIDNIKEDIVRVELAIRKITEDENN